MKARIKVLYVQEPAGGGSLYALYELIKNFDKEIVSPFVLCYYKNQYTQKFESIPGCEVFYLYAQGYSHIDTITKTVNHSRLYNYFIREMTAIKKYFTTDKKEVQAIERIIRKINPDIIHHNNGLRVNRSSIRAAEKLQIPQLLQTRGIWNFQKNSFQYFADRYLSKNISKWIFINEETKDYQKELFHIPHENLHVFNDIVNDAQFHEMPVKTALQTEMEIHENDFVITSPGRIIEWKGHHILLKAINTIKERLRPFKLLVVGSYENGIGSGEYLNFLKQLVVQYEIENDVIFTGDRNDMPDIFNLSNLIVHSSIKPEPQGLVIIEALFCKKNIIATNAGGPTELIEKYGGVLVQPGNVDALANAVLHFYTKRNAAPNAEREKLYERLKFDFDKRKQIAAIMQLYNEMLIEKNKGLMFSPINA